MIPIVHVRRRPGAKPPRLVFGRPRPADAARMARELGAAVCGAFQGVALTDNEHAATCRRCVELVQRAERRASGGIWLVLPRFLVLPGHAAGVASTLPVKLNAQ